MFFCDFSPCLKVTDSMHPILQPLHLPILLNLAPFTLLNVLPLGRTGTYCQGSRVQEDQRMLKITMPVSCARCKSCAALWMWSIYQLNLSIDYVFCSEGNDRCRLFGVKVV